MHFHRLSYLLLVFATTSPGWAADSIGDPAAGKSVIGRCSGCHSIEPNHNMIGPSLAGVVGRPVASVPGFAYSPALVKGRGATWTMTTLDAYLASPAKAYPGNRMGFSVPDPRTRADIVAYLATLKGK